MRRNSEVAPQYLDFPEKTTLTGAAAPIGMRLDWRLFSLCR
jgi:hypothetical protein